MRENFNHTKNIFKKKSILTIHSHIKTKNLRKFTSAKRCKKATRVPHRRSRRQLRTDAEREQLSIVFSPFRASIIGRRTSNNKTGVGHVIMSLGGAVRLSAIAILLRGTRKRTQLKKKINRLPKTPSPGKYQR